MKSSDELRQLAIDVVAGHVCLAFTPEAIDLNFGMVLGLLSREDRQALVDQKACAFYERLDRTGARNMFYSCGYLVADEWLNFLPLLREKHKALHGTDLWTEASP